MNRIKLIQIVFVFLLISWNCDINESGEPVDVLSDSYIRSAIYSDKRFPSDFFKEDLSNINLSYIAEWDVPALYEPATDSPDTAAVLVKVKLNNWGMDESKLTAGNSTDKYFEFRWTFDSTITSTQYYFRVHKSSYFDGVRLGTLDENKSLIVELGKINYRPFSIEFVQEFFDRLWFFKHHNFSGRVVLKRTTSEIENGYKYLMYFAKKKSIVGWQDRIFVYKGEFVIDRSTGVSQIHYSFIKEIEGR